ncbi:hypothetical protein [Shewanella sp. GXUN23E]|uniref:hypothetical protein n=1 Tax=Shewanella sp. GXUN23E TaxID=3422498 RepID=UPI003D7DE54F
MGFLDKIFGNKPKPPVRVLDHPAKLNAGDMLTLDDSFALPPQLRGQQLKVERVSCYEYERSRHAEWLLKGRDNQPVFMMLEQDDEELLAFSIKLTRAEVEQLFNLDEFAQIFEQPGNVTLKLQGDARSHFPELAQWLADEYHQVSFATFGYFHLNDYRLMSPPAAQGDAFESYCLDSADEQRSVEIEVYESGETDVMLTLYRPLTDIRDFWPGASQSL